MNLKAVKDVEVRWVKTPIDDFLMVGDVVVDYPYTVGSVVAAAKLHNKRKAEVK